MLHIVNKSPYDRPALNSVLATCDGGTILLIEDGVFAAVKGGAEEAKVKAAMSKFKFYALQADLEARGMADRVIDGVTVTDYAGFVDLVADHKTCQSWL
ncbi:MAG: sulfurtransferase complex subunit TusB [Pseudomonadota bacterium]|uniref:sulfurtransferase complex subunit TusB n=1 Tax=Sulfuricystis thermophila TaxID=2496847 RepID=UPI00103587A7|nr:sulfurtransferase complex subunit TusB [Sulfuricystis thermophila]MDI6749782.1 sulfurtransferase complex subunit TusB [Rhodocyclaceae bacterium]